MKDKTRLPFKKVVVGGRGCGVDVIACTIYHGVVKGTE